MADFEDRYIVTVDGKEFDISLKRQGEEFLLKCDNIDYNAAASRLVAGKYLLKIGDSSSEVDIVRNGGSLKIFIEGKDMEARVEPYNLAQLREQAGSAPKGSEDKIIKAPMPGMALAVNVKPGDDVKKGTTLVIIEAMKMENLIKATHDGRVKDIFVAGGKAVDKNEKLLELE